MLMQGKKKITLEDALKEIKEPRSGRVKKFPLAEILFVAFAGLLCGATSYVMMEEYGIHRLELYQQYLAFANGIPTAWTLRSVISRLDPEKMHDVFVAWMMPAIEEYRTAGTIGGIAIDGKQARRTKDANKKPLHVVSAFDSALELVLGQAACAEKSNEITAIPELLDKIDIGGAVVTIDAIGTQYGIADKILEKKGDYLLTVKKNRKKQYLEIENFFAPCLENNYRPTDDSYAQRRDAEHGRIELHQCWVSDDLSELPLTKRWKGVKGVAMIRRQAEYPNGKTTNEIQYVFFSRAGMTAEDVMETKRKHWGIENGLHWVLDMIFREDDSRARHEHSAENLNTLRHMAFNVLQSLRDGSTSFASLQRACLLDDAFFNHVMESIGFATEL